MPSMPSVGDVITLNGRDYRLDELVAVQWNPALAEQFPDSTHGSCRQLMRDVDGLAEQFDPPRCVDYHCPRCGAPTGSFGHRQCETRAS